MIPAGGVAVPRQRAREIQRLEKLLEDAGIKLAAVATDLTGVSGRAMLEALVASERAPEVLADLAKRRMRSKIPELTEALTGRFSDHHAFLVQVHLDLIDQNTRAIEDLTARIEVVIAPFRSARELMITIPGISIGVTDVIIAETGADMSRFPTAGHLASWAGTCPGSNESAGRVKSTQTRPGNPYLKGARWASLPCPPRARRIPISPPSTGASPRGGDRSRRSWPSNTPCSLPSGTCSKPALSTPTQEVTFSPGATPTKQNAVPSISSARWVTPSHSSPCPPLVDRPIFASEGYSEVKSDRIPTQGVMVPSWRGS
jgi:hypothetical protein